MIMNFHFPHIDIITQRGLIFYHAFVVNTYTGLINMKKLVYEINIKRNNNQSMRRARLTPNIAPSIVFYALICSGVLKF